MKVDADVVVTVRIHLEGDEVFEATSLYGLKPRPVAIDRVRAEGGKRWTIIGSGARINKDGSRGALRAAYVPLKWEQVPPKVQHQIKGLYVIALDVTPDLGNWP